MNRLLSKYLFYYPATLVKGEAVYHYLEKYRAHQFDSPATIKNRQLVTLKQLLTIAYARSPYYKRKFDQAHLHPDDFKSLDHLHMLPTLNKQEFIDNESAIYTNKHRCVTTKTTGGSTGQPVTIKKNSQALARERAATWRAYEWAGISVGDRQARFWGIPHSRKSRLISHCADLAANRLRISAFDIGDHTLSIYYEKLRRFKPDYLYGYVSAIEQFAKYIVERGLEPLASLTSIVTTAEILGEHQRNIIESAFQTKVFNEYGCGEVGSIAHECRLGNLHIMADNLIVEVDSDDTADQSGELVITDLFNTETPMIRYRLGDFGRLSSEACNCGINLPILSSVYGRAYDLLYTNSGKKIHPESLIYIFEELKMEFDAIGQFQAIQMAPESLVIKIKKAGVWPDKLSPIISERIKRDIDPSFNIEIEFVDEIAREPSGKQRLVKRLF